MSGAGGIALVDTHAHLDAPELISDVPDIVERARAAGVRWIITVGAGRGTESAPAAVALAHTYDEIAACVGIHPDDADCATEAVLETLASLAEDARVVAIGETGLDYRGSSAKEPQQRALRDQVRLARAVQKPLVIHTRAAAADTVAILREESAHHVGGVVHSCTEGVDFARAMLDLEFDIALSPLLQRFDEARALARFVPSDRMLLETSAPYHPPKGAARAEPAALPLVADLVAELVGGVKADDVARWTARNALRRFGLEALPEASHRSLPSLRPATLARADPKRP